MNNNIKKKIYWLENPVLHDYFSTCMWELPTHWGQYIKEKYFLIDKLCLSIGCGKGELERGLFNIGCVKKIDAFDIDSLSIEEAKRLAEEMDYSINYFVEDANIITLDNNRYDFVIAHNSIHHIRNLEHIMQQISNSLKDGGLFIIVEYVGPTRFIWTDQQLKIINDILKLLPGRLKQIDSINHISKESVSHETLKNYLESDPSEAIRSGDILDIATRYFDILEERNMGGTILHLLFSEIINNFNESKQDDQIILKLLCYYEKSAIENGVLSADFKLIIFKKKDQCEHY